jgi:hypothetical protein
MHPRIVELEALLSEEKEKSLVLELENECLHAENQSLKKHLAGTIRNIFMLGLLKLTFRV